MVSFDLFAPPFETIRRGWRGWAGGVSLLPRSQGTLPLRCLGIVDLPCYQMQLFLARPIPCRSSLPCVLHRPRGLESPAAAHTRAGGLVESSHDARRQSALSLSISLSRCIRTHARVFIRHCCYMRVYWAPLRNGRWRGA